MYLGMMPRKVQTIPLLPGMLPRATPEIADGE
jgi:hypothetical protein